MKSSIKVHLEPIENCKGLQPIIAIKLAYATQGEDEDQRDYTLKSFFEQLGLQSSWLSVKINHDIVGQDTRQYINIYPVTEQELPETVRLIEERIPFRGHIVWDNSLLFESFLKHKGIPYYTGGHYNIITDKSVDIFKLGQEYEKYQHSIKGVSDKDS